MGVCREKAVGGEDDGKWQLGVSRRRWAVVNSRYQVRTGCYQTFKAESNWLLLQQGVKRWCCQNHKTLPPFGSASSESTRHKSKGLSIHEPRENVSSLCSCGLLSGLLSIFLIAILVGVRAPRVLQVQRPNVDLLRRMLFPSWEGWCTHAHSWGDRMGPTKKKRKACSVYYFFYFYASLKCFLRIMVMCLVRMCLHVWVWNHALVYMWLLWNLRKTLSVNTAGPGSSNLGFSDSPVLFTCVVSSCRWTASVSIFVLDLPFLSWHKHFVVLQQSICLLSERGLYTFKWAWGKTEVPTHPVG